MIDEHQLCTCLKCGSVHMGVSRAFAENEVRDFNEYFATLTPDVQRDCYGGRGASVGSYEKCWCLNNSFRAFAPGDCPDGVTLGSVIWEAS